MRTQKILKGELVKAKSWELLPKFPYTAGKRAEVSYKDLDPQGFWLCCRFVPTCCTLCG